MTTEETERQEWAKLAAPINPIKSAVDHGDGITNEHYMATQNDCERGDPEYVMSRSALAEFSRCPHRWLMGYKDGATDSTDWGVLIDCLALDHPDAFKARFAVQPDTYLNEDNEEKPWNNNAKVCRAWKNAQADHGRQIVKPEAVTAAQNAIKFLLHDEQIRALLQHSRHQVMLTGEYHDEPTGLVIPLKALVDIAPIDKGFLVDLKTCESANARSWAKSIYNYWYDAQAALYLDLWNTATGENRKEFRHILQESYAPWETAKRIVSSELLSVGRSKYLGALQRYAQCLKSGHWEGYDVAHTNADLLIDGWLVVAAEPWMIMAT